MIPFYRRLQIKPHESESVLRSMENKFLQIGTVLAVWQSPWWRFWDKSSFKEGDIIMFNSWGVDSMSDGEQEYFFVLEDKDFILGKYEL